MVRTMVGILGVVTGALATPEPPNGATPAGDLGALAFLGGDWTAAFQMFAETWGDEGAGTAHGTVSARFGAGGGWFEMLATTELPGSGAYEVRVVIHDARAEDQLTAFVVNSFGGGATYSGTVQEDSSIVFVAQLGNKLQRVRYASIDGRVRYRADESYDGGATYLPHTEAWWTRASAPSTVEAPRVAHIEVPARDPESLARFYDQTFGWSFQVLPDEKGDLGYWLGGARDDSGVTWGVFGHETPDAQPIVTVYVPDIQIALKRFVELGGSVAVPTFAIPGSGWLAYVHDPDGNALAIFETDLEAKQ